MAAGEASTVSTWAVSAGHSTWAVRNRHVSAGHSTSAGRRHISACVDSFLLLILSGTSRMVSPTFRVGLPFNYRHTQRSTLLADSKSSGINSHNQPSGLLWLF